MPQISLRPIRSLVQVGVQGLRNPRRIIPYSFFTSWMSLATVKAASARAGSCPSFSAGHTAGREVFIVSSMRGGVFLHPDHLPATWR